MGSRLEKNSKDVRKRIENHTFHDEQGEEYEGSTFGGFSDYMRRKKIKLQNLDVELRSQSIDKPQIFRGIVAHVNGYTQPPLNDLHVLIVSHGGGFLQYLDAKTACTHIIASQLTPKKKAEFAKYRIVRPAWIVESVKAGKLLPWDNYRLVDEGVAQKVLGFDNGQVVSQVNRKRQSYREQTDTSGYTLQANGRNADLHPVETIETGSNTQEVKLDIAPLETHDTEPQLSSQLIAELIADDFELSEDDGPRKLPIDQDLGSAVPTIETSSIKEPINDDVFIEPKQAEKRKLTAEEHNAILLQNPHMAKSSTANPDFLNQYYRESRLHHLSHWKAELKAQLQARAAEKTTAQKGRNKRAKGARRYIMHVDFDSFFAAVSLRKNPQLIDLPVVIAHGSGPGSEIASCNYPARKFGVKNGMWMKYALELCSNLKVLPYDYDAYEEASRHFYDSILAMDGIVQSISIDEALIDVSVQCVHAGGSDGKALSEGSIRREQAKADELARSLRAAVREKTGCDVSVGIGGNILLAKVALRKAKPAGQHQILPEDILGFIGELNVTDLPSVAYSLGKKLEELGVTLVKDIRGLTKERLVTALGPKTGERLWDYSRGIDKTEVGDQVVRKSVSAEINWGIRFVTQQQAEEFVQSLCDELHKRLLDNLVKGKQLTMKIMRKAADAGMDPPKNLGHGKCDTFNKSVVLGVATNDKAIIGKEAISILRSYGFSPGELRGLGVQMQRLEPLKPVSSTSTAILDGSQRRLTFKKPEPKADQNFSKVDEPNPDVAEDVNSASAISDSIEEVKTPEKPRNPFPGSSTTGDSKAQPKSKPLNMLGTQFILPSQVDPSVLDKLPEDIRSKLAPKSAMAAKEKKGFDSIAGLSKSRSTSPYLSETEHGLPGQRQLDPEILAALPEDVRDEVMVHYRTATKRLGTSQGQSLLPQSPRKANPLSNNVTITPVKKHKISSLLTKGSKSQDASSSNYTQSSFVSVGHTSNKVSDKAEDYDDKISDSFLSELPEEIRSEILSEQRRSRMKAKSGLNVDTSRRKPRTKLSKSILPDGQLTLHLPSHPDPPTFTSRKLSTLPELRDAVSAWVQEFSEDGEQGPFDEDTDALGVYLSRVVAEEGDMAKAISVLSWLDYLIDDWPFVSESTARAWIQAAKSLRITVQEAVEARGLPSIDFNSA